MQTLRLTDKGGRTSEGDGRTVHQDRWGYTNFYRGGVPPTPVKARKVRPRPDLVKRMTQAEKERALDKWRSMETALDIAERERGDRE